MRILTLTTLYPNAAAPAHGVFVENRLRALTDESGAEVRVVAPVPYFPFRNSAFGKYAAFARAPRSEERHGVRVDHPRYVIPPKVGMTYAARALEKCFLNAARALIDEGWDFDLIDAHYYYPDGVAAVRVAETLGKPVVVTARGSDVNLITRYSRQRKMILEAARKADANIAVAAALKDEMIRLGAAGEKITTLRNGVDLETFRPLDRDEIRTRMNLAGHVIASVGHLIERKGHALVIESLKALPDATLLIAGEGAERRALEARAEELGVDGRVRFLGAVPHERLAEIYNAADVLALASSREGWPNVLLEAMACGTPCVATPVWGSREVIRTPAAGKLAAGRSAGAIGEAISAVLASPPERRDTRAYAEAHSWTETAQGLRTLFKTVIADHRRSGAVTTRPLRLENGAPRLIVTVDAEEEFDWSQTDRAMHTIGKPGAVDRLQMLCEAVGAKPLYFITYPLLQDAETVEFFRALRLSRTADIGVHLHAWATPPMNGFDSAYFSFQSNLPVDLHRRKLEALAAQFETVFGERPRAHRAGRYGLCAKDYPLLREAGIDFDFSPGAAFDFSTASGPDFSRLSNRPFTAEGERENRMFVFPVSGARALRRTRMFLSQEAKRKWPVPSRAVTPMRLSPEGASLEDLKALATRLIRDGVPVMTFTLHSSSLTPGANAYAPDQDAVEKMLSTTQAFFNWFSREKNGEFVSLDGLARMCGADAPSFNLNRPLSRVA